jgi:transposase
MYQVLTSPQETYIPNEPVPVIQELSQCTNDACRLKTEYRILKAEAGYWKIMHHRAVLREQVLKRKNEELEVKLRLRERQLFGQKTEKKAQSDKSSNTPNEQNKRPRGQQKGTKGHGRKCHDELPIKEDVVDLPEDEKQCPCCGLPFNPFPGTEDSEVIEIDVRAYRRIIKRKRYTPSCRCTLPGIITAPAPKRLIPKGKLGISVWVNVLLDKFLYYRPTYRLLAELGSLGLPLSQGTITGGLKYIKSLFEPIKTAIVEKNRSENRWHADETRWQVFEEVEGKVGYRWWLWVFISSSTVVYILDPFRSAEVPKKHFKGIKSGILSVDRYSAYKVLLKDGSILLAFCWAHVRRDFISVAKDWPKHEAWAMIWISDIGELYRLNEDRLDVQEHPEEYPKANMLLKAKIEEMENTAHEQQKMDIHPACNKVLKSLKDHWKGLTLFVDHPEVPMDNNISERKLRGPAMGRKNYYGAGKKWSGSLAVNMFTIFQTLLLWNLNPRTWLNAYLQACADNDNQPPSNLAEFLPWEMSEIQRYRFSKHPSWNDSS